MVARVPSLRTMAKYQPAGSMISTGLPSLAPIPMDTAIPVRPDRQIFANDLAVAPVTSAAVGPIRSSMVSAMVLARVTE